MASVNTIDGIKYGFRVLGYAIAVFLVGIILMSVGGVVSELFSTVIGGLMGLVGFMIFFAGFIGVQYKIIADGVEAGVTSANGQSKVEN